jgi:5-methylcytosine-specific restriction endonuclease McrA
LNNFHENRPEMDTPEYKAWRYHTLARDNFICQLCKQKGKQLQVHHIVRWADNIKLRYLTSNGITLCKDCHATVTGHEDSYIEQFKRIIEQKKFEKGFKVKKIHGPKTKYRPQNPRLRF